MTSTCNVVPGIAIDPPDAPDRDDALWAEPVADGWLLHVSIADVASALTLESPDDRVARTRAYTWYALAQEDTIHMLPIEQVHACSVTEGVERAALTLTVHVRHDGSTGVPQLARTRLRAAACLSYADADALLAQPLHPLHATLRGLERLASALAYARGGGLPITERDPRPEIGSTRSCRIVEECMVLANWLNASLLADAHLAALYRGTVLDGNGFFRARYVSTPLLHADLALPVYMHSTSPIRRYADIVNQRQLHALLDGTEPAYDAEAIATIATELMAADDGGAPLDLAALTDRTFGRLLLRFRRHGFTDAIRTEAVRRLAAGALTAHVMAALLLDRTMHALDPLRVLILEWAESSPYNARDLLNGLCHYAGWEPPAYDERLVEDGSYLVKVRVRTTMGEHVSAALPHEFARAGRGYAALDVLNQLSAVPQ